MEKQIKRYIPSNEELEGLDEVISKVPELQNIIKANDYSLELIIKGIDSLRMEEGYKKGIKQLFIALQKCSTASEIYKYSNFRNQETIETLLKREEQYKKIINDQASKHKDNSGIDEMHKMFSNITINPEKDKKVSTYTNKKIKDIKYYDDFKPIFSQPGEKTYKRDDLLEMKSSSNKGPTFKNVDTITVKNSPEDVVVTTSKRK